MLIFVFVDVCGFCVLVVVFLCCYAVKLGKAKKETKKKAPPQKWKYFREFFQDKLWLHVPKLLLFCWLFSCFLLVVQKHYKNRFF